MDDPNLKTLLGVIILIVFAVVGWTYRDQLFGGPESEPVPVVEPAMPVEPEETEGPQHPIPEPPPDITTGKLVELPPLDDSDAYFLFEFGSAFGTTIESLLLRDGVIDRLVTTVDNLPRRELPEKIRPVGRIEVAFTADSGDDGATVLGLSSYERYDGLIAQIYYADTNAAYDIYQRFYPLFQQAYERLGYPDAYFNDRLVEVIDHLIATPLPKGPIVLTRPNVLYEFADPDLEALSSGQKLLLRIGPNNAATLKRVLKRFRNKLVTAN